MGLPPRCHDCAFTPGTAANLSRNGWSLRMAELCAMGLLHFYCHVRKDAGEEVVCIGWAEKLIELHPKEGSILEWKRELAREHVAIMLDLQDGKLTNDEALEKMREACIAVGERP